MKNNHSLKAIVILTILILLCSLSIIFISINKKDNSALLEATPQIKTENKFTPRESKKDFENYKYLNNLGGSNNETLLNSFITNKIIITVFETTSYDYDLCENKNNTKVLAIAHFDLNGSLIKIKYVDTLINYIDSYIKNDFLYIFYNKDLYGYETQISLTTEEQQPTPQQHNYLFDKVLLISNEFVYIYKKETNKTLFYANIITDIATEYSYFKHITIDNKDYIIFSYQNNYYFYCLQENTFSLTFEECEIVDIMSSQNNLLLLFKIENSLILSKFNKNLNEEFSTHISDTGTNKAQISTKNNGYIIYEITSTELNTYFICLHGDIIETNKQTNTSNNYEDIILNNNTIILLGKNKSDNFFITLLNENLVEKKYMALSSSAIYNYNLHIKDDVITLLITTSFNSFEFIDSFGNKDIFLLIK